VRHLRSRPASGSFPDGLRLRYARNGVIDHLSMGNAQDEAVEISYTNNVTIQDSILAETIGDHAQYGGMLINYTNPAAGYALDNLTLVRNVWNRIQGRYPEFSRESGAAAAGTTMHVELTNNLFWDQRYFIDVNPTNISGTNDGLAAVFYQMNWVGNSSFAPSSNRFGCSGCSPRGRDQRVLRRQPLQPLARPRGLGPQLLLQRLQRRAPPGPPGAHRAPRLPRGDVLPAAPCAPTPSPTRRLPPRPDGPPAHGLRGAGTFDSRAINTNPANDALRTELHGRRPRGARRTPTTTACPTPGRPPTGLNPAVQDHNGTSVSVAMTGVAGYTNLECYLNELSARRVMTNR
jgi:hypothetical protein